MSKKWGGSCPPPPPPPPSPTPLVQFRFTSFHILLFSLACLFFLSSINYDFKTISDLKKVAIQQVYCDTIANLLQELINPVHDQYLSKYLKQIVEKFDEERAVDYEKIEELIKRENQEESRVHTPFLSKLEQVLLAPDKRFKRISDLKEFKEMIESINKMTAIKQLTCTPDNAGKTPLYLAASSKNFSRVKMLLRLGAGKTLQYRESTNL